MRHAIVGYLIPILIATTTAVGIVVTFDYFLRDTSTQEETRNLEAYTAPQEYCLKDIVTQGGGEYTFTESEGGVYDYQIIATSHGIEVWERCN